MLIHDNLPLRVANACPALPLLTKVFAPLHRQIVRTWNCFWGNYRTFLQKKQGRQVYSQGDDENSVCFGFLFLASYRFVLQPKPAPLLQIWMMLSNAFLAKIMLDRIGIQKRLRKLHKPGDISKIAGQAQRTLIAPPLCKPRATRYSSRDGFCLPPKCSRGTGFVMPNAASPAPGLQKQPVRNERRARAALRSTSLSP